MAKRPTLTLTITAGAPLGDNHNASTAGGRGPQLLQEGLRKLQNMMGVKNGR